MLLIFGMDSTTGPMIGGPRMDRFGSDTILAYSTASESSRLGVFDLGQVDSAYEYDFGDGWDHKITLEKTLSYDDSVQVPCHIKGKRACPPEDCGGVWG